MTLDAHAQEERKAEAGHVRLDARAEVRETSAPLREPDSAPADEAAPLEQRAAPPQPPPAPATNDDEEEDDVAGVLARRKARIAGKRRREMDALGDDDA